jgi:hypothetical protein
MPYPRRGIPQSRQAVVSLPWPELRSAAKVSMAEGSDIITEARSTILYILPLRIANE